MKTLSDSHPGCPTVYNPWNSLVPHHRNDIEQPPAFGFMTESLCSNGALSKCDPCPWPLRLQGPSCKAKVDNAQSLIPLQSCDTRP